MFHLIQLFFFCRSASLQEQFLLKSIIAEFQSCGLEEALYARVYFQHVSLCRFEGCHQQLLRY